MDYGPISLCIRFMSQQHQALESLLMGTWKEGQSMDFEIGYGENLMQGGMSYPSTREQAYRYIIPYKMLLTYICVVSFRLEPES